jgi:hypothetical protein
MADYRVQSVTCQWFTQNQRTSRIFKSLGSHQEDNAVLSYYSKPVELRYGAEITAGSLKVPESRVIAGLLLQDCSDREWQKAIYDDNVLQTRSPRTAKRLSVLIRGRLTSVEAPLWKVIRDGSVVEATHGCLAAAVKVSHLLGDFLDLVVREQYRTFKKSLALTLWTDYLQDCRGRDPNMPQWSESTVIRLRSSVYSILAECGYIDTTKKRKLQAVHIVKPVLRYLEQKNEQYVLRCIQAGT